MTANENCFFCASFQLNDGSYMCTVCIVYFRVVSIIHSGILAKQTNKRSYVPSQTINATVIFDFQFIPNTIIPPEMAIANPNTAVEYVSILSTIMCARTVLCCQVLCSVFIINNIEIDILLVHTY